MKNKKMEKRIKSSITNKRKVLAMMTLSFVLMATSVIMFIVDPVKVVVKQKTRLTKNSEIMTILKQENSPGVHLSAYLFNVTNAEQFISGEDQKLKVEEVGPFTYAEFRNNLDLEFDEETNVVRYTPRTNVKFLPEESIGDPNEVHVIMPNVAMLSMASMISTYPYFTRLGFSLLLKHLKSQALIPQTVQQFLWGYDEPLIKLGNSILPGWISFETLGLLDRLYDNTTDYRLEIGTGEEDRFAIKSMNGIPGLPAWGYEEREGRSQCNTFNNSYEGIAYPADFPDGAPVRLFKNVLCRFLPLEYQGTQTLENNVQGRHYKISKDVFHVNNETSCLCKHGNCMNGVSDLSPCFYKLPLGLSNAHFMDGDPALFERIEGLKPDEQRHGSNILIEPKMGIVLKTAFSVQVNVIVKEVDFNDEAARFSNMVVPVSIFRLEQPELPEESKSGLKLLYIIAPYSFWAVEAALFILGLLVLWYCIRRFLTSWIYSRDVIVFQSPDDGKSEGITTSIPLLGL